MGISGIALGQSAPRTADTLRKNALGAPHIVFFVIAAAAPLTAVVGVTPAAFQLGNGPGVPVTFLLVGGLYLLFSAGFIDRALDLHQRRGRAVRVVRLLPQ